MRAALLLCLTSRLVAASNLTALECVQSFLLLSPPFDLRSFDLYESWFDDESEMTLAQAGTYRGVDNIKEYVMFAYPTSPYISVALQPPGSAENAIVGFDEAERVCVMSTMYHNRYAMSPMAGSELFQYVWMTKLEWRFDAQKIGQISIYYDPSFLEHFFATALQTPQVYNFVCQTMQTSCPAVWAANGLASVGECEAQFEALPISESNMHYIDGNTQGCRMLHAVFAVDNAHHCAHISFEPMQDPGGLYKCQTSAQIRVSDLFSDNELANFEAFAAGVGFTTAMHWRYVPCETRADCPTAGSSVTPTINGDSLPGDDVYTSNYSCEFFVEAPTSRSLLFSAQPYGVCVPASG